MKTNHAQSFIDFISASPSSYHAAQEVSERLVKAGYMVQHEDKEWSTAPGGHVMVRSGAVMAWVIPQNFNPATSSFKIVGSHADSPGFMLKPNPDYQSCGFNQVGVEVYGGPLLHTWFDRELVAAGQVVTKDGARHLVNSGPALRIPSLAIHLYRKDEFTPDRQLHLQPVLSTARTDLSIMDALAASAGIETHEIQSFNVITADAQPGELLGPEKEFICAGRMDNLSSVFASLAAFLDMGTQYDGSDVLVMAAFDHEEVGSSSRYGAAGPLLEDVLTRTANALGASQEQRYQMFARSSCVSVDAAHSVHPNYAAKHDPQHHPIIGQGPVTKLNGNQRYASDAASVALWESACERAGVPYQRFVGRNDVPCGSTIGPITATRLGISTVDVGIPMLSMHSAREMVGSADQLWLSQAIREYLLG